MISTCCVPGEVLNTLQPHPPRKRLYQPSVYAMSGLTGTATLVLLCISMVLTLCNALITRKDPLFRKSQTLRVCKASHLGVKLLAWLLFDFWLDVSAFRLGRCLPEWPQAHHSECLHPTHLLYTVSAAPTI